MSKQERPPATGWLLALLFGLPLLSMAVKTSGLPFAEWWSAQTSLHDLSRGIRSEMWEIMFVPLGAMVVVFFRLTLGLRLMGPFRSILLAIAFRVTGVAIGLAFLTFAVLTIAAIRPAARAIGMGYYARITIMLCAVSVLMTLAVLLGGSLHVESLQEVAHFPIIVLCLIADAFSRTRQKEGLASAIWRVAITAGVALPLAAVSGLEVFKTFTANFPEFVLVPIGVIILIHQYMNWKAFEFLNPVLETDVADDAASSVTSTSGNVT